jgi:hypothetical protein
MEKAADMISGAFAAKSTLYLSQRCRGKQTSHHACCTIAALWIGFAASPWIARASAQTADEETNTDYDPTLTPVFGICFPISHL